MSIDHQKLLDAIQRAKDNSYGTDETSALGQKRAKAIEYYLGLNTNPAPQGRSQVVDRSVYETIQVMLPSLVKIFAGSSDEVCKAIPIGPDDEAGAEQTTAVLRHYVTEKNNWEQICADWIHDGLLLMNGYCMAYWDESEKLTREVYEGQSEDQAAMLLQDANIEVVQQSRTVDKQATQEAQEAYQAQLAQYQQMAQQAQAMQTGQMPQMPPPPQDPGEIYLYDLVIDRKENEGKVCIKVLPPEHCSVSIDTPDWTLNECPYFEFRQQKTIAELREMGLEVDEGISDDETTAVNISQEDSARNRFGESQFDTQSKGIMRRVWTRMIWIQADAEKDHVSRLYYVIAVGKTILYAEPCSRIRVSSLTAQPLPHRHPGLSVAETVFDLQDIKMAIKRGALDNLYLALNGRNVISSKVNLEDMLDSRPGGQVRMIDDSLPGEGHIVPLVHPFAFDSIIGSLEYFDQDRQNRTGASRYFSGTDAGAINKTASGTMALQNMASMRMEHIARMMAPAVENLFSIVWEIIAKHANKALTLKLKGKWTPIDPQAWRTKRDIRISVGVGAGNKESMIAALNQTLAAQMQVGLPLGLVTRDNIQATNAEIAKLQGFANSEKFWPDPHNLPPPPQQPNPEMLKLQAEQQKTQAQMQADAQKFQAETERKKMELGHQSMENDKNRAFELEKAKMDNAVKLAIAEQSHNAENARHSQQIGFEAAKIDHQSQREDAAVQKTQDNEDGMAEVLSNLQMAMQSLQTTLGDFSGAINRPRTIAKDAKGQKYARPMTDEEMNGLMQ